MHTGVFCFIFVDIFGGFIWGINPHYLCFIGTGMIAQATIR